MDDILVYPGIFHKNPNGSYTVTFPDLLGCVTDGRNLKLAMEAARKALGQWCRYLQDEGKELPKASYVGTVKVQKGELAILVMAL